MMDFYKKIFTKSEELDHDLYKEFIAKELILRDYLAIERTILTNEGTFLDYIRTSLTISVVGVTLFHISPDNETFQYAGIFIALFGFFTFIIGSVRTVKMKHKINKFLKKKEQLK